MTIDVCETIEKYNEWDSNVSMIKAAAAGDDEIADARHIDELARMKQRLNGLLTAFEHSEMADEGLLRLLSDVVNHMNRCVDAFDGMRQIRRARRGTEASA
jgi:hypothetical protein